MVGPGPDPTMGSAVNVYRYNGTETTLWFSLHGFPIDWTKGTNVAAGLF